MLQPRVTPTLPTDREGSLFQRISSGPAGIDPYASAVSDVYQDLFGEGSYIGKGIYDVDAFEAALAGRVPENALLSHDLFEGIFARAGLVTDIEFFEEFPSHYEVAVVRQHRWARGDWQLLPWIIGHAPDMDRARIRTSIPLIGRWKMLDNLRRTLSAPAAFLTLIAGWTLPFASPVIWTTFVLACIAIPALLPVLTGLIPHRRGISKRSHARAVGTDLLLAVSHVGLTVTLLADQAWLMADAISPDTLARLRDPPKAPRMGDGSASAVWFGSQPYQLLSPYERHGSPRCIGRPCCCAASAGSMADCGAVRPTLGAVACGGVLDQPAAARSCGSASFGR